MLSGIVTSPSGFVVAVGRGLLAVACGLLAVACGSDDDGPYGGVQADQVGVGAECSASTPCPNLAPDAGFVLECLAFKGGYCGLRGCQAASDCPAGSLCVAHDDGQTYCFRTCGTKAECNVNRSVGSEANCSSNVTFTDGKSSAKACVPPSG